MYRCLRRSNDPIIHRLLALLGPEIPFLAGFVFRLTFGSAETCGATRSSPGKSLSLLIRNLGQMRDDFGEATHIIEVPCWDLGLNGMQIAPKALLA